MATQLVVIDDGPTYHCVKNTVLQDAGYDVTTYPALSVIDVEEIARMQPALIILDWFFGALVGLQLLQQLLRHHALQETPILLCTATVRDMGAVDERLPTQRLAILLKPFDRRQLLRVVQQLVTRDTSLRSERSASKSVQLDSSNHDYQSATTPIRRSFRMQTCALLASHNTVRRRERKGSR